MESPSLIREDLLHYVWKTRQFSMDDLHLTDGRKIKIQQWGFSNNDAGPDFTQVKIMLDGIHWVGNVEMHTLSSMWTKHGHNDDPAYDNVILHVVYDDDHPVKRNDGSLIPTLTLKERIPETIRRNYTQLISSSYWIPCEKLISGVDPLKVKLWLYKLAIERLERKTSFITSILGQHKNDWEQVCFIMLSRYLGANVNMVPMELLARSCDIRILYKNGDNLQAQEAILFGISGLLNSPYRDSYPQALKKEYQFYKKKYHLTEINPVSWKFARMRPGNFPTIRIAQLASIIFNNNFLFRNLVDANDFMDVRTILQGRASSYWDNHYRFDESANNMQKKVGKSTLNLLIINVIAPLLFVYAKIMDIEDLREKALSLLEKTPTESNTIIKKWNGLGIQSKNALRSQALIQLKQEYCNNKNCLKCAVGSEIMNM